MKPFYKDDQITLYCGDMREVVPQLGETFDAIITDPPYEETRLEWDRWPDGWPSLVAPLSSQLWCFGSLRLFMEKAQEFTNWKLAQDVIWEKQNGSGFDVDRFKRVHEIPAHFYQGKWSDLHLCPQKVAGIPRPSASIGARGETPHRGKIGSTGYEYSAERAMKSVIRVKNCHSYAIHPTQKPTGIIIPLVKYSVPPRGSVLDTFAGSGTTLEVARDLGMKAVGIEGSEENCRLIVDRLAQGSLLSLMAQ